MAGDRPADVETEVLSQRTGAQVAVKLVVVAGASEGQEVPLEGGVRVGTDPACQLTLDDAAVSRQHAVVSWVGGQVAVKDLGSRNGTYLGETRVVEAVVPIGAVLAMGNSAIAVQPRFHVREVTPAPERRFGDLVAESVAMRELFAIMQRVAPTDVTVLIEGESGTGKELAARAIHAASSRADAPYVVFDCASVPRDLVESQLFGYRRGAFSGAVEDRAGAFQTAHGGTICFDEIGELPLDLQPKLLRALETGEVRAVGDDELRKVDVRVLASTNRELGAEARRGSFRSDLLYRLEVVKVRMPPLRYRPEDIAGLVGHLLRGKLAAGDVIGGDNLRKLVAYGWPGNVRELRNVLERAVALAPAPVRFADLVFNLGPSPSAPLTIGPSFPGVATAVPYKEAKRQLVASFDRAYVEALLERHQNNISAAAAAAGVSRKALYDLIRRCETGGE
ncbi:MAG: sigma 54-dependent Fis family transcriptional regulator [Deltaproteobacteria bacterium]|jgi:DNA-binding NtrC family response regulator|nr:sigma 54-dependent Fis family transcriptional regulator [Deltaproteobacteria bacterium]MBW2537041.1 sigma 54-dependent Fis family transcriptional regulator [Deltaproteobacteria bacterium]